MAREHCYHALIIKKQPLGEADELITVLTEETGKLRVVAKSVKFPASKLQQTLQPLFYLKLTTSGSGQLPIITGAQTLQIYRNVAADSQRVHLWYVAAELVQKALGDAQPNAALFYLLVEYVTFLDRQDSPQVLNRGLLKFKICFFQLIGLQVHTPPHFSGSGDLLFSSSQGGFYVGRPSSDSRIVEPLAWEDFTWLRDTAFDDLGNKPATDSQQLPELLSEFVSYQLERDLKSERFLGPVGL